MITTENLNLMAAETHRNNARWWVNLETGAPLDRNKGELLMLVITELAEACEGVRKGLMDDKVVTRTMEEVELADALIRFLDYCGGYGFKVLDWSDISPTDNMLISQLPHNKAEALLTISMCICAVYASLKWKEEEDAEESKSVSGCIYCIIAYCEKFNLDLMGAYTEKTAYNLTRQDHTHEARKLAAGKKF